MRRTLPLSADYPSDADRLLLPVIAHVWPIAYGYSLDEWQRELLRAALEIYPEGHPRAGELRYRQVVISLGRQNGKTEIAAALGLYALLRQPDAYVIGIAHNAEQARLVYDRTMGVIRANPLLAAEFEKLTETRGIHSITGGRYEIKAAKSAALQGLPLTVGLCDEVHLLKSALWTDLVNGTGGRKNGLVVGITTAGDETSVLLKDLYELGAKAIEDPGAYGRFGFFCWEASEATLPDDDDELVDLLMEANPALATGRLDVENIVSDVRSMPASDAIRYRLNRFVASETVFIPMGAWGKCTSRESFPAGVRPVFSIDRTPDWGYASIVAAHKGPSGTIHTELVASLVRPSLASLTSACMKLARHGPATFAVDGYALKDLGNELKMRGQPVRVLSQGDQVNASAMFYAKVVQHRVSHGGDPLLSVQLPRTKRKPVGEGFRISRQESSFEIDAVMATASAVFVAETHQDLGLQVF